MTERVEQRICIKFCINLEHSSVETIWIQKAAAMGSWWLAASPRQHARSCIKSCAGFFGETSNHPVDSAPYSPDLAPHNFWLFPKLNHLWKGRDFRPSMSMRFRKIQWGSWWLLGELCEVLRSVHFEGDWGVTVPCTLSLVPRIFFSEGLHLSNHMAERLLDRPFAHTHRQPSVFEHHTASL